MRLKNHQLRWAPGTSDQWTWAAEGELTIIVTCSDCLGNGGRFGFVCETCLGNGEKRYTLATGGE